jgi:hypothetical protein
LVRLRRWCSGSQARDRLLMLGLPCSSYPSHAPTNINAPTTTSILFSLLFIIPRRYPPNSIHLEQPHRHLSLSSFTFSRHWHKTLGCGEQSHRIGVCQEKISRRHGSTEDGRDCCGCECWLCPTVESMAVAVVAIFRGYVGGLRDGCG